MIKKKPSFPFETIAVAIAFSPRMEAMLCETKRLVELFDSKLILIHAGKQTPENIKRLNELLEKHQIKLLPHEIIWREGDTATTVLTVCKEKIVDLLVLGALVKETFVNYYLGTVSREICRKAKCSVLTLIHPTSKPVPFQNIIVNGEEHPKTIHTFATSVYLAKKEKVDKLMILKEIHLPTFAMSIADECSEQGKNKIKNNLIEEEINKVKKSLETLDISGLDIQIKSMEGKPGHTIGHFAHKHRSDLLVINSPNKNFNILDRIFTHDLEFILKDIPCNLLIVHSRV